MNMNRFRTYIFRKGIIKSVLICVLILLNLFLLYSNTMFKKEIFTIKQAQEQNFPILNYDLSSTISIIHPDVVLREQTLTLSIFIPDNSCYNCLEFEVLNINEIYTKNKSSMNVYILGDEDFIKEYNPKFIYKTLNKNAAIFDRDLPFSNPLAALSDSQGKVYDFYIAEVNKHGKSDNFYQRMSDFLKVID